MITPEEKAKMEAQAKLSKSLSLGIVYSILPVAGLGSIAAIVIGLRSWKKINASNGDLVGLGVAAWCICAGALGLLANIIFFGVYLPLSSR